MTVRTLAEAAAEVLNRTRATAPSEPMHSMSHEIVDLGGATHENPRGDDIGSKAAAVRPTATPPGTLPAADSKEGMKKLKPQAQDTEAHPAYASQEELGGEDEYTAGYEYTHPTVDSIHESEMTHHDHDAAAKYHRREAAKCYEEGDEEGHKIHHRASMHHHAMSLEENPMHMMHESHMTHHDHHAAAEHHFEQAALCHEAGDKEGHEAHLHAAKHHEDMFYRGIYPELHDVMHNEEMTEEEIREAHKSKRDWMKEKMSKMQKEDMDALFNGETLSEEFKNKASTIFEAAVLDRAVKVSEELEREILQSAEEAVEEIKQELEEQVDAYLNYMVQEWVNENRVAINSGLKSEIVEDFMAGLKNLFEEHYIDVPDEKVDVIETMAEEIEELKNKLNESINSNIELSQAIVEARKSEIVLSVCEGLTATQSEKVKTLAEGVEFTTEGEYIEKMRIIRENYFTSEPNKVKQANATTKQIQLAEASEINVPAEVSPAMEHYVRALSRTLP